MGSSVRSAAQRIGQWGDLLGTAAEPVRVRHRRLHAGLRFLRRIERSILIHGQNFTIGNHLNPVNIDITDCPVGG